MTRHLERDALARSCEELVMTRRYRTLRVAPSDEGVLSVVIPAHRVFPAEAVRSAKRAINELTLPGADAIRADARRFQQLVRSDAAKGRTAALSAQGLQTRGPLELHLGDRIVAPGSSTFPFAATSSRANGRSRTFWTASSAA
jgi:hypothetical protein